MSLRERAAREAFVCGLPSVALYGVLHDLVLAPGHGQQERLNRVVASRAPAGHPDTREATSGDSTAFSAWFDLRSGPVSVSMPSDSDEHVVQATLLDLYAEVLGRLPTESLGHSFLVAGPSWEPSASTSLAVLRCRTDLCLVLGEAEPGGPGPVQRLRPPLVVQPVREGNARVPFPAPVAPVDVSCPPTVAFLAVLDWMLPLMPTLPGEEELRAELELTGVSCGGAALREAFAEDARDGELTEGLRRGYDEVRRGIAFGPPEASSPIKEHHLARAARMLGGLAELQADLPQPRSGSRCR